MECARFADPCFYGSSAIDGRPLKNLLPRPWYPLFALFLSVIFGDVRRPSRRLQKQGEMQGK